MGWSDFTNLNPSSPGFVGGIFAPGHGNDASRGALTGVGQAASGFAGTAQGNYNNETGMLNGSIRSLQDIANGRNSISAEQLRQSLQQNQAQQMGMAAGASPANQAMAARTAAIQSGRLGAGLAGQQAVAGLQERQQAQQALASMLLGARGQDVQGTLGGYGAATNAYGQTINQAGDKSPWDQWSQPVMGAITGGASFGMGGKGK